MRIKSDYPASRRRAGANEPQVSEPGTTGETEFPSARYFQVHFEFLQELLGNIGLRLDALRQQIADLQHDSGHSPADQNECQPPRQDGRIVSEAPEAYGTKPAPAGPTLSLQGGGKHRKSRRKTATAAAPSLGMASKE